MKKDFSGLKRLQEQLSGIVTEKDRFMAQTARGLSAIFLREVKKRTPVRSGKLRRGWKAGHAEKRGGLYITRVQNPVSYAPYVEYGHRTRGAAGVPEAQRKRKWVEGQFMMTNSVRATEAERKAFAAKRFDEFLKGGGKRGG